MRVSNRGIKHRDGYYIQAAIRSIGFTPDKWLPAYTGLLVLEGAGVMSWMILKVGERRASGI